LRPRRRSGRRRVDSLRCSISRWEQQVGQCPQRQDYETTTGRRQVDETPTSWARTDTPSSAADVPASCCSASAFSCHATLCEQQRLLLCLVLRSSLRRAAAAPPAASRSQFGPTRVLALMARQRGSCTLGRGRWSRWRRSCCSTDAAATWRRPSRRAGHRLLLLGPVHHVPGLIWACTHAAASQWTPRPRSLDAECREGDVIAGAGQLPVGADRPLSPPWRHVHQPSPEGRGVPVIAGGVRGVTAPIC